MRIFNTERNDEWIVEWGRYEDVKVKFFIRSDDLSLESVSKNLGLTCTKGYERGDVFIDKLVSGETRRGEKLWGVWAYESEQHVSSDKLKDHLDFMLSVFEPRKEQLKPYLEDKAYTVVVRIDFHDICSVVSCDFNKETMTRIMDICNEICICLRTDDRDLTEDDNDEENEFL